MIYACVGCSGAGQIACKLALHWDKVKKAEMSCLAGLVSGKKQFQQKIKNRHGWVIDGCSIECAKSILTNLNLPVNNHIQLFKFGEKKNQDTQSLADFNRFTFEIFKS